MNFFSKVLHLSLYYQVVSKSIIRWISNYFFTSLTALGKLLQNFKLFFLIKGQQFAQNNISSYDKKRYINYLFCHVLTENSFVYASWEFLPRNVKSSKEFCTKLIGYRWKKFSIIFSFLSPIIPVLNKECRLL